MCTRNSVLMLFLLVSGVVMSQQPATENSKVSPYQIHYAKDSYEVERHWLTIRSNNQKLKLSAFVHLPVLAKDASLMNVLPDPWKENHAEVIRVKVGSVAERISAAQFHHAVGGTPLKGKLPVLIFGPGLGWLPSDYYEIILPLVRKGVIVVTIASPHISKSVHFPDGSTVQSEKVKPDYNLMASYLQFAVDEIIELSQDKNSVFYSRVDVDRIFIGGHSLSGASAILAATSNKHVDGIINLDGDVTPEIALLKPLQAILYITTQPPGVSTSVNEWGEEHNEKRRDNYFAGNISHAVHAIRIKIPEMFHSDFQDVAFLKKQMDSKYLPNRFGTIDPNISARIVSEAILTFITKQSSSGWVDLQKRYPQVWVNYIK